MEDKTAGFKKKVISQEDKLNNEIRICSICKESKLLTSMVKSFGSNKKTYYNKFCYSCAGKRCKYTSVKSNAKKRMIDFSLTKEEFWSFENSSCHYCNEPYDGEIRLDRKESNIGYHLSNVVPCCKICNFMKQSLGLEDFKVQILKIFNNLKEKNQI